MKTRDRILECALQLFNEKGEPNVSTMEVANEMGISPGNLYYHFHGKEPLIHGLFERFQAELSPMLDPPADVELAPEGPRALLHGPGDCRNWPRAFATCSMHSSAPWRHCWPD